MFTAFRYQPKVKFFVCFIYTLLLSISKNISHSDVCQPHHNNGQPHHYKVILFDSYGTLIDVNSVTETVRNVLNSSDPSMSNKLVDLWRMKQLDYTWLRSLMISPTSDSYKNFWIVTHDALKFSTDKLEIPVTKSQRKDLMNGWLKLRIFDDVNESLSKLKQKYKLAVLSNGTPRMLTEVSKLNGLYSLIDQANEISVDEVRVFKPHPMVYALAETKLSVPKSEILFVSGNGWDAIGSKAYGFPSIWLNRNGEPEARLGVSADMEVSDLHELAKRFTNSF